MASRFLRTGLVVGTAALLALALAGPAGADPVPGAPGTPPAGKTPSTEGGIGADGTDLGPAFRMQPLAGHRDQCTSVPKTEVAP